MDRTRCFRTVHLQLVCFVAAALVTASTVGSSFAAAPVRVGARARVDHVELEVHRGTGNLFAIVRYTVPGSSVALADTYGVALNISTDGGDTWTEAFNSPSPNRTEHLSATVVHDYLYLVTERSGAESGLVDIRRFAVSNGGSDATFGFHTVVDVGVGELNELVLFGNADGVDGAIYLNLIDRDGNLRFFHVWDYVFDDGGSADDWNEVPTGVTDASANLDAAFNAGDSDYSIFVSYIDYSLQLCVWRLSQGANNATVLTTDFATNDYIRIAADDDLVMVIYSRQNSLDRDIRVHYSYSAGTGWGWNTLALAPGNGTTYGAPTISGRWHRGMMVAYHRMGTGGDALATSRRPLEESTWTLEELSSGIGLRTGTRTDIQPLVEGSWGMLFISDTGDPQAVYFMLTPLIFADGFASGDMELWSSTAGVAVPTAFRVDPGERESQDLRRIGTPR